MDITEACERNLADDVYRQLYKSRNDYWIDVMKRARHFVLDKNTSSFMADVGHAAYEKADGPDDGALVRRANIMDNMRRLARLPHKATWIEWDPFALMEREVDVYQKKCADFGTTPLRAGVLITQHPKIDTAFSALFFGRGRIREINNADLETLGVSQYAIAWCVDDNPLPWHEAACIAELEALRYPQSSSETRKSQKMAALLTGCENYVAPISLIDVPNLPDFKWKYVRTLMVGQYMLTRLLLGLLATINDVPIQHSAIVPSKGFVGMGLYRRYLERSVITLNIPMVRYKALARKVVMNLHRRAHQVRGHWRENWRKPLSALCQHKFINLDEKTLQCVHCKGEKDWIAEHQRGDASLGFVIHDYHVQERKAGNA